MNKKKFCLIINLLYLVNTLGATQSHEFPTLIDWTARCLSSYDERFDSSIFSGSPVLSQSEFNQVLDCFLQKFKENDIDKHCTSISSDFKYPYVSKLEATDQSIIIFTGDLHGSLHALLRNLWRMVALGYCDKNFKITKKNCQLIFLGDYVDRGRYGVEVFYTLLRLKCANWNNVHLVRGNHEVKGMNEKPELNGGGFWHELQIKYQDNSAALFSKICDIYQELPLAVYITLNNQTIMAAHAGFGPYEYYYDERMTKYENHRHIQLKESDLLSPAFQWCDIIQKALPVQENKFIYDPSRVWRIDVKALNTVLAKSRNLALFRGHQHSSFGLKMLFNPEKINRIIDPKIDLDTTSTQYHWVKVVQQTNSADLQENNTLGFKIGPYVPLFTFSSGTEGVLEPYDCFGLLFMHGPFTQWRLKVYEFESPLNIYSTSNGVYTTISKNIKHAKKSSSGMSDVIWPKFSINTQPEGKIAHMLRLIN